MTLLAAGYGLVLGSVFASFLGVVVERVPRGLPITGRSRCACGRQLRNHENVPVLGWLRARGVAGCCGARLPVSMLVTEVTLALWTAAAFVAAARWAGDAGWVPAAAAAAGGLLAGCAVLLGWGWWRTRR